MVCPAFGCPPSAVVDAAQQGRREEGKKGRGKGKARTAGSQAGCRAGSLPGNEEKEDSPVVTCTLKPELLLLNFVFLYTVCMHVLVCVHFFVYVILPVEGRGLGHQGQLPACSTSSTAVQVGATGAAAWAARHGGALRTPCNINI